MAAIRTTMIIAMMGKLCTSRSQQTVAERNQLLHVALLAEALSLLTVEGRHLTCERKRESGRERERERERKRGFGCSGRVSSLSWL